MAYQNINGPGIGYDDYERDKNERQRVIEEYIIEINNKLYDLCNFMKLDVGIKQLSKLDDSNRTDFQSPPAKTESKFDDIEDVEDIDEPYNPEPGPQAPPKTDWERIDITNEERMEILKKARDSKLPNVQKDLKWNPQDFYQTFKYLENAEEYKGPFIVSIYTIEEKLQALAEEYNLKEEVSRIYQGKYLMLNLYDITASDDDSTVIVGLEFLSQESRFKVDTIRNKGDITETQSQLLREYFEAMGIENTLV